MKLVNKMTVALIALFCMGNLGAYTWKFMNDTDKTIDLHFGLKGVAGWFDGTVAPGKSVVFDWPLGNARAGFCMYGFEWKKQGEATYNPGAIIYEQSELSKARKESLSTSTCRGRDIVIIEQENKILFVTEQR